MGKLDVDGKTVALATVVAPGGLAVTKASQIVPGQLTAWLADGTEVPAEVLATDAEGDLALVRIQGTGLRPVTWGGGEVEVGRWAISAGIEVEPQAVGIVSVGPRPIHRPRVYLGVQVDLTANEARLSGILPGLGAERAGLKVGDVILAVDGREVGNGDALVTALRRYGEGDEVRLRVRRDGGEMEVEARLDRPLRGLAEDRAGRWERMMGETSERSGGFERAFQHDTVLPPWLCGGPVLNLEGEAMGVNIARAGRVATYALPSGWVQERVAVLLDRWRGGKEETSATP